MSCEVAALPFQAHANYGTWSLDFGAYYKVTIGILVNVYLFASFLY